MFRSTYKKKSRSNIIAQTKRYGSRGLYDSTSPSPPLEHGRISPTIDRMLIKQLAANRPLLVIRRPPYRGLAMTCRESALTRGG